MLTDEDKEIYRSASWAVSTFLRQINCRDADFEDAIQVAAMTFVKAKRSYDPSKPSKRNDGKAAAYKTFATVSMQRELWKWWAKKTQRGMTWLNDPYQSVSVLSLDRFVADSNALVAVDEANPADGASRSDESDIVWEKVDGLNKKYSEAIVSIYQNGEACSEVARRTGVTRQAVAHRCRVGIEILKDSFLPGENMSVRDYETIKMVNCASNFCQRELLGESELAWACTIAPRLRGDYPPMVAGRIAGRPYCLSCMRVRTGLSKMAEAEHTCASEKGFWTKWQEPEPVGVE